MRIAAIVIGLGLLLLAWHLHRQAVAQTDKALDSPFTATPLPPGREDEYFGIPAREAAKTPKAQVALADARWVERCAGLSVMGGIAFIIRGLRRKPCVIAESS